MLQDQDNLSEPLGADTAISINHPMEKSPSEEIITIRDGSQAVIKAMGTDIEMAEQEQEREYDRRSIGRRLWDMLLRRERHFGRTVFLDGTVHPRNTRIPKNVVRNQKYSVLSFVPLVLFEQFKFFFNLYFLIVALTQFFPPLKVGMYKGYTLDWMLLQ